jgi:hypothetical protein
MASLAALVAAGATARGQSGEPLSPPPAQTAPASPIAAPAAAVAPPGSGPGGGPDSAAPAGFDPAICETRLPLTPDVADACRFEFRKRVEADRAKLDAWREEMMQARAERARRRAERAPREGAPIESFLNEDLAFGDVVVTEGGPLVFIGRDGAAPRREDFVPLDSPRSPRRRDAERLKDATRPR